MLALLALLALPSMVLLSMVSSLALGLAVAAFLVGIAPRRPMAFLEAQGTLVAQTRVASAPAIVLANKARPILKATTKFLARQILGLPSLTFGRRLVADG